MGDNLYKIAGNVMIPEEKREEFNRYILRILDKGGIRKTEEMRLGGRTVTVISRPVPDSQGIVSFDYSIFEKRKRETGTYNINTCQLLTPDRGYQEFGLVMNMIMVMQESYSENPCYFMHEDKPCSVDGYIALIRKMLGIEPELSHRAKIWDMLLFLKNTQGYESVTAKMIWKAWPYDLCPLDIAQFLAAIGVDSREITAPRKPFIRERSEIKEAPRGKLEYYVYQVILRLVKERRGDDLELFLSRLLDMDLSERKRLTEDSPYGVIAEVSLYVLPSIIVHAYAVAVNRDFWEVWRGLGIKGYSEILTEQRDPEDYHDGKDKWILWFYKAIQRENEYEFIEFWEDEELDFSEGMKECLSKWRERFGRIHLEEAFDTEGFLTQIVVDLDRVWGCRLVDKAFITEFIEHKDEDDYKKALLLYREFMDEDTAYFPELTKKQANQWVIRGNRNRFDFTAMSGLQSLLINHKHRYEILGF